MKLRSESELKITTLNTIIKELKKKLEKNLKRKKKKKLLNFK